jgi:hypothetical protein
LAGVAAVREPRGDAQGRVDRLTLYPQHRELGPGLLADQIKKANLSLQEFIDLA